jgi:type IV pilus assembly protein PilA
MRAYKRMGKEGFTLVELMIVVAIIGVLAALAIYGVRRYLASAKTSEAKNTIGAIARGADAAYQRETTASEMVAEGASSAAGNHALCTSSTLVPLTLAQVAGTKYQPQTADNTDFETGTALAGWRCLKFGMTQAIYYQYSYVMGGGFPSTGLPGAPAGLGANSFEAAARGDVDADTVASTFTRAGTVNTATRQLVLATQVFIDNEFE